MGERGGASQVDYAFAFGYSAPYDALTAPDAEPTVELVDAFGRWALPSDLGVTSAAIGLCSACRSPASR
ncbi:MAG: hypothetical protein R3F59_34355 [Myxococcota bacterium]